ncbi:MAG: hypothetical protein QM737_01430 [Ferruginibacter sp.]
MKNVELTKRFTKMSTSRLIKLLEKVANGGEPMSVKEATILATILDRRLPVAS